MRRIFQNSIALMVVVIVLFLIVPLHPALLDILIITNISLSIVILMVTMTISEALEFSIFPSLLLRLPPCSGWDLTCPPPGRSWALTAAEPALPPARR